MADISTLRSHPKNRNAHPKDQIKRLAKILEYQGFRYPIKVSKASGFVTSGHGRIEAAKENGWTKVPVNYQEYDSSEQEYADVIADNSIASWSELDLSSINSDIGDLIEGFEVDLLGIKEFSLDMNFEPSTEEEQGKLDEKKPLVTQCPNCGECFDANENKPKN